MSISVLIPHLLLVTIFYINGWEEPNDYYTFMFQLPECARHCSPKWLNELLKKQGLSELPEKIGKNKHAEEFVKIVLSADPEKQEEIEVTLHNVQSVINGTALRLLSERAHMSTKDLPEDFDDMKNYDKALWLWMFDRTLFKGVVTDSEIEDAKSWITYRVPLVKKSEVIKKIEAVKQLVCKHYQPKGRARFCHADAIEKDHYVGIATYPLNYARSEDGYDTKGGIIPKHIATAFEVYFLYIPIESEGIGYMSVKIKEGGGGFTDAEVLAKLFASDVLGKDDLNESDRVKYKLNKLKELDVVFDGFDDKDAIESVKVASVVLYNPAFPSTIILRAHGKSTATNMADIADSLRKLNVNTLNGFDILNTEMIFKFKKNENTDWKSKGVVRAKISSNRQSSCNLGINAQHMIVRKYLRKWNIEGK